jgi:hypothetical protein
MHPLTGPAVVAMVIGLQAVPLGQQKPQAPTATSTITPEMTCPTPLGPGVDTGRAFCDVMSGVDPAAGIVITLPPHRGPDDYFRVTAGALTLGERFKGTPPSPSRIDEVASNFTDFER